MQGFRKYALVVCLSTAIALSATNSTPKTAHRHGSLDDSIITKILDFFGIELQSRYGTPPG
jgi:hypothetical protein